MSPRIATHQIDVDDVVMCIRSASRGFPTRREIRIRGSRCVEERNFISGAKAGLPPTALDCGIQGARQALIAGGS